MRQQFSQHPEVVEAGNAAFQEAYDIFIETMEAAEARARAHDKRLEVQKEKINELTLRK